MSHRAPHGARVPRFTADVRDPAQEALFQSLVTGPRGKGIIEEDSALFGPFNALLLSPRLGEALQALGLAVQADAKLPERVREAVILAVAARRQCSSEWAVHRPRALAAGLTPDEIAKLDSPGQFEADGDPLWAALHLTAVQLDHQSLDESTFSAVHAALGERGTFEVAVLVGYYDCLCSLITLYQLDA